MPLIGIISHPQIFSIYLGVLLVTSCFFFVGGGLLLNSIAGRGITDQLPPVAGAFLSLLSGTILFTVGVSLFYAQLKTVHLCFILLFVIGILTVRRSKEGLWESKRNAAFQGNRVSKVGLFGILGGALIGYFILQFYFTVTYNNFPFYQPSADLTFYSAVSDYLIQTGFENTSHAFSVLDESFQQITPYHYFELWLTGGISKFSGLNTFLVLTLVVSPLFFTTIFLGIVAILEALGVYSHWMLLVCVLFPLMDRLNFPFFYHLPLVKYADPFNSLLLSVSNNNVSKIGPYFLFVIPAILFVLYRNYRVALLFLLGLPVATITTAPAVFMGLAGTLLLVVIFKKVPMKEALVYGGYILVLTLGIAVFYLVNKSTSVSPSTGKEATLLEILTSSQELKVRFNLFVGNWVIITMVYFPFLALYLHSRFSSRLERNVFKRFDVFFLVTLLMVGGGFLAWAVLSHMPNSSQLGARIATSLFNLILFITTLACLSHYGPWGKNEGVKKGLTFLVVGWLLFNGYQFIINYAKQLPISEAYGTAVSNELQANAESRLVGCLIAPEDFSASEITKNSNFYVRGYYLSLFGKGFRTISLSDFDIPDEDPTDGDELSMYARDGVFYDFVEDQKKVGTFVSIEKSQLDFLKENKIQHLVLSENYQLHETLKPYVKAEYLDNSSRERFILLHKL